MHAYKQTAIAAIVATPDVFTSVLMFWAKFLMSDVLTC